MAVVKCDMPAISVLDRHWIEADYFRNSYRVPLLRAQAGVVDIFFAIFGHHPLWMKIALIIRNRVAVYRCTKQHSEPSSDKRGAKVDELHLTPLELIARIATLVPPPRTHRGRYFGMLAANSPLRWLLVNQQRWQEIQDLHGVRSLFPGAIFRLVQLNGLSVLVEQALADLVDQGGAQPGKGNGDDGGCFFVVHGSII